MKWEISVFLGVEVIENQTKYFIFVIKIKVFFDLNFSSLSMFFLTKYVISKRNKYTILFYRK